ncbi:MAG: aldo/keto reductase [Zoogloeaceae bacterium]|nr:aldo/keto reductase [Zoogloeaceae bacterium]
MERRQLGRSDLAVSSVCLGTMTFGQQNSEAEGHAQLDRAFERGVNFIDAAEMYPVPTRAETYGETERIIGTWLARKRRDEVVIATKAAGPGRRLEWIRGGPLAFDSANLRAAVEGSLHRLGTDYIDLYQLHWPARNQPMFGQWKYDPDAERVATPIEDTLAVLGELVREGKIRAIGISNEHPWGLMRFLRVADEHGLPRVASIQNAYNLLNRVFEYGLAEMCQREAVSLLAYSPLGFGALTGKYLQAPATPGRMTLFPGFGQRYAKPGALPAIADYAALARRHGLTPTQLALGFVHLQGCVTSTIIGATSLAQLDENLDACATPLAPEILQEVDALHLTRSNPAP